MPWSWLFVSWICVTLGLSVAMAGGWLAQKVSGNGGWADSVWSLALGLAGVVLALLPHPLHATPRQWVVAVLVAAWGLRLGLHIAGRSRGAAEDPRYAALRRDWGDRFQVRMFLFLQVQAAAAAFLALSMQLAAHNPAPFPRLIDWAGIAVLAAGIVGEAVSDSALRRFRADKANAGRVCDTGPWALSRHPNYFFEWLGWVAYPLLAIDLSGQWNQGLLALTGPAFMYYLLVHVSGIPLLEEHMLRTRGDAFRAYQARVSAFFPRPPKASPPRMPSGETPTGKTSPGKTSPGGTPPAQMPPDRSTTP